MIDKEVISKVTHGVCAVGFLIVPLTEYRKDPSYPYFEILGTGFLVRPTTVITNRHVIEAMYVEQKRRGFPSSQFFLSFIVPDGTGSFRNTVRMIRHFDTLDTPDIGFVEFQIVSEKHFDGIQPLAIVDLSNLEITEEVAVCGYPYGTNMLTQDGKIYRWGPVIQQGSISAISPFDGCTNPDEILLDVRTAGGMSGAPIFRPSSGEVIGLHYAGWEATTALGLPLTQSVVNSWLTEYDKKRQSSQTMDMAA
jgi:S1-C subfamily serine protease